MIKTTLEWYTLDEKLPTDLNDFYSDEYVEFLCAVGVKISRSEITMYEMLRWWDGQFMIYSDGEWVDTTSGVKYWAYVPKIGVE